MFEKQDKRQLVANRYLFGTALASEKETEREVTSEKVSTKLNFFFASISKYVTNSAFYVSFFVLVSNIFNLFSIVS